MSQRIRFEPTERRPAPAPERPPTENELGAMILIAAFMNMIGDHDVILDERDVNLAIDTLRTKRLVITQDPADRTTRISLESQ